MQNTQTTMNELYQNLGKLFYAVAICDGSVHTDEWERVKELVKRDWLAVDDSTDRYGTDAANQIEVVFNQLMENNPTGEECFDEFKDFFTEHPHAFTKEIKALIGKTANSIANSFSGRNKSELVFLAKLSLLLK